MLLLLSLSLAVPVPGVPHTNSEAEPYCHQKGGKSCDFRILLTWLLSLLLATSSSVAALTVRTVGELIVMVSLVTAVSFQVGPLTLLAAASS